MSPHLDNVRSQHYSGKWKNQGQQMKSQTKFIQKFYWNYKWCSMNNKMLTDSYGTMVNSVSLMKIINEANQKLDTVTFITTDGI